MDKEELKIKLKPLTEGLFGKQQVTKYEKPQYEIRPIEDMLRELVELDDVCWGRYAFSREPLNGKFSDEQRSELTVKAVACGIEYAKKYMEKYQVKTPEELADKLGMVVAYPEIPQNADRVLFAEFKTPNKVFIYSDALKKASETMEEPEVRMILGHQLNIGRLLLAHELFHFVEEQNEKVIFTRTERVELWAPKPFHNRSGITVLGEIAAMAFAKQFVGISYSPYVMDVFLVYGYNPQEASGLYEEIMELANKQMDFV